MGINRRAWVGAVALCLLPVLGWTEPPGPTNNAVLLPRRFPATRPMRPAQRSHEQRRASTAADLRRAGTPSGQQRSPAARRKTSATSSKPPTRRESHGDGPSTAGVFLLQPVFQSNPAFWCPGPAATSRDMSISATISMSPPTSGSAMSANGVGEFAPLVPV